MKKKLLYIALAALVPGIVHAFTDSVWIMGAEGQPGDLVTVEVWLQYEGGGLGDSLGAFDIPLTWDANVCTVEAVALGLDFLEIPCPWQHMSLIDNQGTEGPPPVPKVCVCAWSSTSPIDLGVERGTHLAATLDVRILSTAEPLDSTCIDTLMEAFSPPIYLEFTDKNGIYGYAPSFSTGCIHVLPYTFSDSLWIVGAEGYPGDLVPMEVWLQYEGGGYGDSISAFDIPLTFDATVCTVEAITIGPDFRDISGVLDWTDASKIDNQGTQGPPPVPKIVISAFTFVPFGPPPVARGIHLAGTVDVRILSSSVPSDSSCIDTLMQAFTPLLRLGFVDKPGLTLYVPSFSANCIRTIDYYCGDANADGRITSADIVYVGNHIYRGGPAPYGEGDVNLDGRITVADAIYLGHYIYRGGPEPCNP